MAFSLRLAPFLPDSDSSATHTGSSASSSLAHSLIHAMCTGRGLIAGVARARLPYTECPVSRVWDPHARGGISQCVLGPCLRAGCIHAALVVCGSRRDALGAGRRCLAPQVGGDSWSSCSGLGGAQLGGVLSRGHVAGRSAQCLPAVRSRACVDAWDGAASGGSFRDVAPVSVWGLRLMLH